MERNLHCDVVHITTVWVFSLTLDCHGVFPIKADRVIQDESGDSNGGNVQYVTMRITFVTRKFGNVERNSHCDLHITPVRVARLVLDLNGVFEIKAYGRQTPDGLPFRLYELNSETPT